MTFPARLTELIEKATKRPWSAKYIGTAYPDYRYLYMPESEREKRNAQRKGMYVAMFPADVDTDEAPYRDNRDIRLVEFLVNHAEAIRDLVVAAEKVTTHSGSAHRAVEQSGLLEALAKLKEPS